MAWYKDNIGTKLVVRPSIKISIKQAYPKTLETLTAEDHQRGWIWVSPDYFKAAA